MTNRPRVVFDTGVLVSAAIFNESIPGRSLLTALHLGEIVFSPATIHELQQVLTRAKFDRYLQLSTRRRFMAALIRRATIMETAISIHVCRDPQDDKFLELAATCQASYLITGDDDLLVLNPYQGIPILTPADFLAQFAR
jgi:uncharacterized protein